MKKVLGIILFTVLFFGFTACAKTTTTPEAAGEITIEVYGPGEVMADSKTVPFQAGDTLLGLLLETYDVVCQGSDGGHDETCSFQTTYGTYIMGVGTVTAFGSNEYIALYINGEYAMTGIDATPVVDGNVYAFKHTTF